MRAPLTRIGKSAGRRIESGGRPDLRLRQRHHVDLGRRAIGEEHRAIVGCSDIEERVPDDRQRRRCGEQRHAFVPDRTQIAIAETNEVFQPDELVIGHRHRRSLCIHPAERKRRVCLEPLGKVNNCSALAENSPRLTTQALLELRCDHVELGIEHLAGDFHRHAELGERTGDNALRVTLAPARQPADRRPRSAHQG